MRPTAGTGNKIVRKEYSAEIYLLSDIMDKVLVCKFRNKDKFTTLQLNLTAVVLLHEEFNWVGVLHELLKNAILSMAQSTSNKGKYVRIICYCLLECHPKILLTNEEAIAHTTNKDINKPTLKFVDFIKPSAVLAVATNPTATTSSLPKSKKSKPFEPSTTSIPKPQPMKSKAKSSHLEKTSPQPTPNAHKKKKVVLELTDMEIIAKAAKLTEEVAELKRRTVAPNERASQKITAQSPATAIKQNCTSPPPKFKCLRKGLPTPHSTTITTTPTATTISCSTSDIVHDPAFMEYQPVDPSPV